MTLNDCTKAELIFIVKRLTCTPLGEHELAWVIRDVEQQRNEQIFEKTTQLADCSRKLRMEFCELMAPYEGKPLYEVPEAVLNRARECLKEAEKADRKWMQLNGIRPRGG